MGTLLAQQRVLEERGARRVSPHLIPNMLADSASGQVAIDIGARGPNMAVVSACATGGHAIGEAMETILRDDADIMVAGSTEAIIYPIFMAGFINMRALADDPDPRAASKPFDARRSGFVLSEGAAVLVLEEFDHARRRGAHIYAEVVGYGSTSDAYHMASQLETGMGAARTMQRALAKAGIAPDEVDYINAHGTGTPINDRVETLAIKHVFGDAAREVAISSTKSTTGHMMGAAGSFEAMVCALAIRDRMIPPTINLRVPDPECDLDYTPLEARSLQVDVALSNSIGLGGHNSSIILKRV
jgi:3-oxoacyl-(acyl-carrier-protein) synthase